MTRNPYSHPTEPSDEPIVQARLSGLAVASFVFGLLCCIPGSGLIGTILGGAGLIRISQSEGRLGGRTLAFVGLALGLFGTALWLAIAVGTMYGVNQLTPFGGIIKDVQASNLPAARAMMSASASAALTDEVAAAFSAEVNAELGKYQRLPKGLGEWFADYGKVGQTINNAGGGGQSGTKVQIPLPGHFEKGVALIMVYADGRSTGSTGAAAVTNIAVHAPSGKVVWLIPQGSSSPTSPPTSPPPSSSEPPK